MTVPIRSMGELVEALRVAQIERSISYETIDALSGLQSGYTAKLLAPVPVKNLGPVSTFPLIGALGKALVLVDDAEQIKLVRGRWKKRHGTGGASMQMAKRREVAVKSEQVEGFALMQMLGRKGGKVSGKKRRAKAVKRRALQRVRSHAARMRWSKIKHSATDMRRMPSI